MEKLNRPGHLLVTTMTAPTYLDDSTYLWDVTLTQGGALGQELRGGVCEAFGTGDGLSLEVIYITPSAAKDESLYDLDHYLYSLPKTTHIITCDENTLSSYNFVNAISIQTTVQNCHNTCTNFTI